MSQPAPHDTEPAPVSSRGSRARRRAEPQRGADFDAFYMSTRRKLLLQALAISGTLSSARHAVRESYIAAEHHWRKVGASPDPEAWVRQRACATAARHVGRSARVEKSADPAQLAVLEALRELSTADRSVAVLIHLGRLDVATVGRQLAMRPDLAAERLANANLHLSQRLGCPLDEVRARLEALAPLVTSPGLPRVDAVRRRGVRRRRLHVGAGTVLAVALTVGAGWFASTHAPATSDAVRKAESHPVTTAMLVDNAGLTGYGSGWALTPATATTSLRSVCQPQAAADTHALHTLVRGLRGPQGRTALQTVEVSASPQATSTAYATVVHWYAGCAQTGVRLVNGYRLDGVGDQSVVLELTAPGSARYLVAVTRSGQVTSTVQVRTEQSRDQASAMASVASQAMTRLCAASAAGSCKPATPRLVAQLPPSGETPQMLATVDMPVLARIQHPWVGTDPVVGGPNLAATTCDHSNLSGGGRTATSRTFLIPQANLPTRFGLTEVTTDFGTPKAATAFMATVAKRMKSCEKRQLGSSVKHAFDSTRAGTSYAGWWLSNEINAKRSTVSYWMGVVRVGSRIAQVGFAPAANADISKTAFSDLLARAGQRLASAPAAAPNASASPSPSGGASAHS